jgi:hypothetical protein
MSSSVHSSVHGSALVVDMRQPWTAVMPLLEAVAAAERVGSIKISVL